MTLNPEGLYTIRQIMKDNLLPFRRGTLHKLIRGGSLRASKMTSSKNRDVYVIRGAEIERFINENSYEESVDSEAGRGVFASDQDAGQV